MVSFSEITLPVENERQAHYSFSPNISVKKPDFSVYKKIHELISSNCIKKEADHCTKAIKVNFPMAELAVRENFVTVKIPENKRIIYMGFYLDKPIPIYESII